ncbi:alkaline phosphatase family protein [Bergeyella sp. RCAD1439]|uniref:alkaline phosphatase family protein n=1 Tax=Bergeyella anatis TaxID=3113737 RepID=UPI002E1908C8|nr:ectonucleotide pyrophosphatase/phosphodiesterase [Bergeyella sp. RCAD1439]
MKKAYLLLLWLFSFSGLLAQIDTAQIVVPGRKNAPQSLDKPYVILISADGFRYDYAEKYGASHLLSLAEQGVRAKAMIPSFPSVTGPNHYTLVTGMVPSHTGFVDNYFIDGKRKDFFSMSKKEKISDGSWLGGLPLWSLAEQQGVLSASLFWVASNSDAGGLRPTYYYDYHEKFDAEQKINIVLNWLKLPEEQRPHFISLYFPEVDKAGHLFGPESPQTIEAVRYVDKAVGRLIEKVEQLGLEKVNFIFVSDHGMIGVDTLNPIPIPSFLQDPERFSCVNGQTLLRVHVKNPTETASALRKIQALKDQRFKVYRSENFPKKLRYRKTDDRFNRIGELLLVPKAPSIFADEKSLVKVGKHGYNPYKTKEMQAVFFAKGSAFKSRKVIAPFPNTNLYPIIARILGLPYTHHIDGSPKTAKQVLKPDTSH